MTTSSNPPLAPKKEKIKKSPTRLNPNSILIGVSFLVLVFIGWSAWQALSSSSDGSIAVMATPTPSPAIPTLVIHHQYERQGAEVTADPNQEGRSDPFIKP